MKKILLLFCGLLLLSASCNSSSSGYKAGDGNSYSPRSSYTNDESVSDEPDITEPENPYDEGSGHSAGFEWAQENDVSDCGGNSQSFIEGCEEYVSQRDGE